MSQLSSGGRKTRVKTKKVNKTLLFLIIFAILCVLITTICIFITLNSRETGEESFLNNIVNNNTETEERVVIGDRFWTNGIIKEEVSYSEGPVVSEYLFSTEEQPRKYEISYEKVSGLKDKSVEDAINKEIEEQTLALKSKLDEYPKYDRIYISSYVTANFSDVLSIAIDYSLIDIDGDADADDYNIYKTIGLNYRLDTGEKLKFEDLFRKDTSIKNILSQALYEAFAWQHAYSEDVDMTNNFNKTDYGYIENQTFKALAEYNKNPDIDFYFYPNTIYATIRDFKFAISTEKFCEDLVIYTKYRAEKLYENSSLQKEFYACTDGYLNDAFEAEGVKGDNFYYEILSYGGDEAPSESPVKAKVQEKVDEKLDHYFELASQNPDRAYMVSIMYYYDDSEERENKYYNYSGAVSELDLDYFRKYRSEIIAKSRMQVAGDVSNVEFSNFDDNVEFYESFSAYVEDYTQEEIEEQITTKEERRQQELEWEEEMKRWEEEYGEE